jgi:hypothetical protein
MTIIMRKRILGEGGSVGQRGLIPSMSGDRNAQRRSQRVMLNASVVVLTQGADNKPVSEETRTLAVNAHGATILLGLNVATGQLVILRNSKTGEEAYCHVVYVSPHQADRREIGVEFIKPRPRFWGISFPPLNWTTQAPEAKRKPI